MGTWNTKIDGNDTFMDVYEHFFNLYNKGASPVNISKEIQVVFTAAFNDADDRNNSLFGLALAQWETKSLDLEIYNLVKEIIQTNKDIELWKSFGADEKKLKERDIVLHKFLTQISSEKEKPKRRVKPKFEFEMINLVSLTAPDCLKNFIVNEEYVNKIYKHTSGLMMWKDVGGSVVYFTGQGKYISAKWLDSQTLTIIHDKDIIFTKKDDNAYYCGDDIKVIYLAQ